ncbi:MAG: hypothetical protein ACREOI_32515 [bacterium]
MKPTQMSERIGGNFHSTITARLLAAGPRIDLGEEQFGSTFLFRSPDGEYFATHETFFDSRRDRLEPLTRDRAITLWARLPKKLAGFDVAFPDPRKSLEMLKMAA